MFRRNLLVFKSKWKIKYPREILETFLKVTDLIVDILAPCISVIRIHGMRFILMFLFA